MKQKLFLCGNCSQGSTEKEWRISSKKYLGVAPFVEKNIGREDKEFCCPKCFEVIDGLRIQLDKGELTE